MTHRSGSTSPSSADRAKAATEDRAFRAIADAAAQAYRPAGRAAVQFARGKLRHDPAYAALLRQGLIPDGARLVDLGCGRALLGALLLAARERFERGAWPAAWPAPPRLASIVGIDQRARAVRAARAALGERARVIVGDLRAAVVPACDAIVILDVLHYLDTAAQEALLTRCRAALDRGGVLLLRVADADAGPRFWLTCATDWIVTLARAGPLRLHCRSLAGWAELVAQLGFGELRAAPMSAGTPFANVLVTARAA